MRSAEQCDTQNGIFIDPLSILRTSHCPRVSRYRHFKTNNLRIPVTGAIIDMLSQGGGRIKNCETQIMLGKVRLGQDNLNYPRSNENEDSDDSRDEEGQNSGSVVFDCKGHSNGSDHVK